MRASLSSWKQVCVQMLILNSSSVPQVAGNSFQALGFIEKQANIKKSTKQQQQKKKKTNERKLTTATKLNYPVLFKIKFCQKDSRKCMKKLRRILMLMLLCFHFLSVLPSLHLDTRSFFIQRHHLFLLGAVGSHQSSAKSFGLCSV